MAAAEVVAEKKEPDIKPPVDNALATVGVAVQTVAPAIAATLPVPALLNTAAELLDDNKLPLINPPAP